MAIPFLRTQWVLLTLFLGAAIAAEASAQSPSPGQVLQNDLSAATMIGDPTFNVDIAGGAIDLTNGAMIVTTSSFGFVPSGGYPDEYGEPGVAEYGDAAIHDALIEGANYTHGFWNGTNGIISSTAANGPGNTGVGWIDNKYVGLSSFASVPVNASQSIIAYAALGDNQLDGSVDSTDFSVVSTNYGESTIGYYGSLGSMVNIWNGHTLVSTPEPPEWFDGDVMQQGKVDLLDFETTLANYGVNGNFGADPSNASIAVEIPEPGALPLMASGSVCALVLRLIRKSRVRSIY